MGAALSGSRRPPTPIDFPRYGSDAAKLRFSIRRALTPSMNGRRPPWRVQMVDDLAELFLHHNRASPVSDGQHRESAIAAGSALFSVRMALRRFGFAGQIDLLPDPVDATLVARIGLGPPMPPTEAEQRMFRAIPRAPDERSPLSQSPLAVGDIYELATQASWEGAWLVTLFDSARVGAPDAIGHADRPRRRALARRAAIANDLGAQSEAAIFPISGATQSRSGKLGALAVTTLDLGPYLAACDRRMVGQPPVVALLGTEGDEMRDWITAGQALGRIALCARSSGIAVTPMRQPLEVSACRRALAVLANRADGVPQSVLWMACRGTARTWSAKSCACAAM